MHPSIPKFLLRQAGVALTGLALITGTSLPMRGQTVAELQIPEAGEVRVLDLAQDEIEVSRKGEETTGRLRQWIETRVPGASVIEDASSRVLVKLGAPYDASRALARSERVNLAVPDAETAPVYYLRGAPRDRWSRRLGSKSILVELQQGQTPEQARQAAGATSVRNPGIQGLAVLKFASAFQAAAASKTLSAQGISHRPLLRRFMEKTAAPPQDQFFSEQWHLINTGQRNGVAGVDVNVLPAWDLGLGNGVTICVVDDCVQTTHPDLTQNCPPVAARLHHDFNDDDDDPKPIVANGDFHGTCVAGLSAARQNNGAPDPVNGLLLGVSGVAPEARLLGIRLIAGAFNDEDIADALTWAPNNTPVHVSNNSWGVPDIFGLGGFDVLAKAAQRDAAVKGRDGKGQITVFSAGNGRGASSNANYSSISNSRYVLTVGAIDSTGKFSSYSEPGAPILVAAPGGGLGYFGFDQRCVTTDVTGAGGLNPAAGDLTNTDYTRQMNGTSSAAPITSGVVALMLAKNPNLGWRDVKEILAGTASRIDSTSPEWMVRPTETGDARFYNGGGFKFSHDYGSGLVDAFGAVVRSLTWKPLGSEVSQSRSIKEPGNGSVIPDDGTSRLTRTFDFSGTSFPNLRLEQIEVEVRITHRHRSDLEIAVISPSGVRSVLAQRHPRPLNPYNTDVDYRDIVLDFENFVLIPRDGGWVFSTTHHWGENSTGTWTLEVIDRVPGDTQGRLVSSAVRLYGTASGQQRVMFDKQLYSTNEAPGIAIDGNYAQVGTEITVTATGHNLAVGETVCLDFTSGAPDSPADGVFAVATSTPGETFTVTAADSIDRTGLVTMRPVTSQLVTIRRLGATTGTFSVGYETTVGTATPGQDFLVTTGTATFQDGQVTVDIPVPILADSEPEVTEAVQLVLRNLQGAEVAFGANTLTRVSIVDDEVNLVKVGATDSEAAERSPEVPADPGVFTITRSKVTAQPLDVFFTLGGTAQPGIGPGGDFNPLPNTGGVYVATIPAFEASVDVIIQPREDTAIEGTETVLFTLLPSLAYQIGVPASAEVLIIDDDRPKVQMTLLDNLGVEPGANPPANFARFSIKRTIADPKPLDVYLDYGGTQILGINYLLSYIRADGTEQILVDPITSRIIQIAPNQTEVEVKLVPLDDDFYQATKTVDINIQPRPDYDFNFGFLTNVHLNIVEDDPFPDTKIPKVTITAPKSEARIQAPGSVTVAGTATDNVSVQRLLYRVNGGNWSELKVQASASIQWTFDLDYVVLQGVTTAGDNTITGLADTSKLVRGMKVDGAGVPVGAEIVTVNPDNVVINRLATASANTTVRFSHLSLGPNAIEVEAIDDDANVSKIRTVLFDYVQMRTLSVATNGSGTVSSGFVPSSNREAGKTVTLKARPNTGQVFNGWTGYINSPQRSISFVMPNEDVGLTADFVPSPFVSQITGAYSGLVQAAAVTFQSSGFLRLDVTSTGAFTGKLILAGVSYALQGEFTGSGIYVGQLTRTNDFPLTLNFQIDVNPAGTQRVVGTVASNTFSSTVIATRAAYSKSNPPPASIVGNYTVVLPPAVPIGDPQRDPRGNGIGTVKIDSKGTVHWSGTLADGKQFSVTQPLDRDNKWPLFASLYQKKGVILGDIAVDLSRQESDMNGKYHWSKPVVPTHTYFPLGFQILNADFIGSLYVAPPSGTRALDGFTDTADNGRVTLQEGSMLGDIVRTVTYNADNKVTVSNPGREKLKIKIDPATGAVTGEFFHPVSGVLTSIQGVLFQKQEIGVGRFKGTSVPGTNPQTGRVLFEHVP